MTSAIFGERSLYDDDHELLRETVRAFVDKHAAPHADRWRAEGKVDRELFQEAARAGILGFNIPEEYGGGGITDFRFNAVIGEEFSRHPVSDGLAGVGLSSDIVVPYFTDLTDDEQKARWLP
ncbi:acyl-CoA dehydrogenase family protein, partial [Streptomyces sp. NPDC056121]